MTTINKINYQTISNIIILMRPHQYIKNLFIFTPLFFDLKITNIPLLLNTIIAFIAFSIVASAIYILNDYFDIEEDKKHPVKKYRPLASGVVHKDMAIYLIGGFILFGLTIMSFLSIKALYILLGYIFLNIAYTLYLKYIAIIDITTIAMGFIIRLFIGSAVTDIELSSWIVLMTFLLALFMALAKRRDDVLIFNKTGKKMRKVINGYNLKFLDSAMVIMASVVIVAYTMYVNNIDRANNEYLYLTDLFVIIGVMRYLQITFVKENSGSPTKIVLQDKFMQLVLIGWISMFGVILY
jgi:4-hydroxybenzoate polyprenyltransferase